MPKQPHITNKLWELTAGDEHILSFAVLGISSGSIDAATFKMKNPENSVEKTLAAGTVSLVATSSSETEVRVSLAAADTLTSSGLYEYQLEVEEGGSPITVADGNIRFLEDIA